MENFFYPKFTLEEDIIADFLNFLGFLDYRKNPHATSLILTILSVLLLGTSVYFFFMNSEFLLYGETAKNVSTSPESQGCYRTRGRRSRTYCPIRVQYQTQKGAVQQGITDETYLRSFVPDRVVYLPQAPHRFKVDPISFFLIFFLLALAIVLFVLSRLVLQQSTNYDRLEEKLKQIGKYYKTRFVEVTEENVYFKDYYSEYETNAMGRRRAQLKSQDIKAKSYKIKTILKIKGQDNVLEFYSRDLRAYDPREEIQEFINKGNKIGVWVNPSKPNEYYMDISFLDY